jgi:hypothetical protein
MKRVLASLYKDGKRVYSPDAVYIHGDAEDMMAELDHTAGSEELGE